MTVARIILLALTSAGVDTGYAQFSPDGGQTGSTAIHRDSVSFTAWATEVVVDAGYLDIARPTLGRVNVDTAVRALGPADGTVVSLGDGGQATLRFGGIVQNGPGVDFVVFENGFASGDGSVFAELAFVEVSSNGRDFVRFPNTSLTAAPVGSFGTLRPEQIDGLAGKFSAPYGVGFDLSGLPAVEGFDVSRVTHVRLVDVVGTAAAAFAKTDSEGATIYDPYPTPFPTGGFDLDAVGLVHPVITGTREMTESSSQPLGCTVVSPSEILSTPHWRALVTWVDLSGRRFGERRTSGDLPVAPTSPGWYIGLNERGQAIGYVWVN